MMNTMHSKVSKVFLPVNGHKVVLHTQLFSHRAVLHTQLFSHRAVLHTQLFSHRAVLHTQLFSHRAVLHTHNYSVIELCYTTIQSSLLRSLFWFFCFLGRAFYYTGDTAGFFNMAQEHFKVGCPC